MQKIIILGGNTELRELICSALLDMRLDVYGVSPSKSLYGKFPNEPLHSHYEANVKRNGKRKRNPDRWR